MEIRNAVVHQIEKQKNNRGAIVHPASDEVVKDDSLSQLLRNVLDSYNSRCSRHTGSFELDEENFRFSVGLRSFLSGDTDFLNFSLTAMERLRVKMTDVTFATGGYLLFVRYEYGGREMLLIAKLSPEVGVIFSSDLHQVIKSQYLNLDRLQIAARVDITAWQQSADRYLTFVLKLDQGHPPEYFKEFIGCRIDQDSKEESKKVVVVVKDFVNKMVDDGAIRAEQLPEYQRRAFDYAIDLRKSADSTGLSFEALANHVWPDEPELFLRFLNDHEEAPSAGFMPDRAVFKRLSNINYKSRGITINMTYEYKLEHVVTQGNTVIINDAPEKLIKELTEG